MHHSNQQLDELMSDQLKKQLGATGKFPGGKLVPHDEGEIAFAVTHKSGKVIIEFGTEVHWVGMTPDQAKGLAESLIKHADDAVDGYMGLAGLTEGHPED